MRSRHLAVWAAFVLGAGCGGDSGPTASGTDTTSATAASESTATPSDDTTPPQDDDGDGDGTSGSDGGVASTGDDTGPEPADESGSDTGEPRPVGSPGCGLAEHLADGEHQFQLDGYDRRYILRLPENYSNDQPWPLVFALHGNGGNPGYWDAIGGDRDIRTAFAQEAVIVIPEAIDNAWRDYEAPPETWPARIELELAYFDTIYEAAQNELCIDTGNVFTMGFSGGGSFSGVLGCRRDWIRAMAVGGSVIYFEEADCTELPAAWITIGDGELNAGREEFRDFFRDHAGCQETSMPGEPQGCIDYDGCGAGTPVTFCSHPAGHVWPTIGTDATKAFFQSFYLRR